jgi:hypothetical protein
MNSTSNGFFVIAFNSHNVARGSFLPNTTIMTSQPPKKISLAFGKKPIPKPANGIKRRAAALHDSDDEDDGPTGTHQEISAFDLSAGGAVHASAPQTKKGPLVIPALPNHDRLEYGRKKRQRSDLPQEQGDLVIPKKDVTFGLLVPEKKIAEEVDSAEGESRPKEEEMKETKTEDQVALDALLGKATSSRTIPLADEDEAFKRDMGDAVDVPTLDQYLAIPPSEFGAACLRGMGWKDTETLGIAGATPENTLKPRPSERRPALLGVGAKPSAALGIEIGEWGKSARGGKRGKEEAYNPVVLKNKKTGEVLTEAELKAKVAEQEKSSTELVFDDKDDRRADRNSRRDDKYRDKDLERKRDKWDSDSRRDRDYKSSRSDSRDQRRKDDDGRDKHDKYEKRDRDDRKERDSRKDREDRKDRDSRKDRDERRDRDKYSDDRRDRNRDDKKDKYYDDRKDRPRDDKKDRYRDDKYSSSRKDRDRSDRDDASSSRRR